MSFITKKKYVAKEVIEEFPLPDENRLIAKIVKPRGNNLHEVILSNGEECLASMPNKFRKHIWVKRGSYIMTEPILEGKKVKVEIVNVLMKEQIKYIKQNNLWPDIFSDTGSKEDNKLELHEINTTENSDSDDELFKNPNRKIIYNEDSTDSSDEDSENDCLEDEESSKSSDEDACE